MNRVYMAWERMAIVSCQWMIDLRMVAFAAVRKLSDRTFCSLGANPILRQFLAAAFRCLTRPLFRDNF